MFGIVALASEGWVLVPRAHVSVLTELDPDEMATVLAGVSRLVSAVKLAYGTKDVVITGSVPSEVKEGNHLHFDVRVKGALSADALQFTRTVVAALAEC